MNKKLTRILTLTLLSALAYNQAALCATATTSFPVSATVVPSCIISTTPLNFGSYTGAVKDSTNIISLKCTSGIPLVVGLNAGTGPGATTDTRIMTKNDANNNIEDILKYSIYHNSARTQVWGDVDSPNAKVIDAATSLASNGRFNLTGFGRVSGGQSPNPSVDNFSTYTDTITVTVSY